MLRGINQIKTNLWGRETIKQCSKWYTDKRKDYEDRLKQFHNDFLMEVEKNGISSKKDLVALTLNDQTGSFIFYKTKGDLSPNGQEFKVLNTLLNSKNHQVNYLNLLKSYNHNIVTVSKISKYNLYVVIRNIKRKLAILPKTKNSNTDIFENKKNFGYRLIFQPKNNIPE